MASLATVRRVFDSALRRSSKKTEKFYRIFNPCRKCLVQPACKKHKQCKKYQEWFFKQVFCKHDWKTDPVLMFLPTSLMQSCTKCGKLR